MWFVFTVLIFAVVLPTSTKILEATPNGLETLTRIAPTEKSRILLGEPEHHIVLVPGVTTTVLGHTMLGDPGSKQRIIDVVGPVSMTTGQLGTYVILTSVVSGEGMADGIAAFDYVNQQVYFSSDGAFGGTVFYVDVTTNTVLPAAAYYLLPLVYLGFDSVSGSRIIAGENTPGKNFLIMDQANWGNVAFFPMPSNVSVSANDAFEGHSQTYTTNMCTSLGNCAVTQWSLKTGSVTSFPLSCMSSNGYLSGKMFANSSNTIIGLQGTPTSAYSAVVIDVMSKSCKVIPLRNLPPAPAIVVSAQYGHKSGSLFLSVASNQYNSIIVYDKYFNFVKTIKTGQYLYEDLFVSEV